MTEDVIRLLGGMQLRVGDPVKLPGAAERGLLALLLISPGRTLAASWLFDRLWVTVAAAGGSAGWAS